MSTTSYASVLGLGFGDCGKGRFVDSLTRRRQAHTVVRFNGGAQAGHNVVVTADNGSATFHHTFSQFGAGSLVPGTGTVLLHPMVVHPTALLVETEALGLIGINALARLKIDAQCRITTPFHQAAGRLRELLRGTDAHGTCGVGVGETIRHALEHPEQTLRYADLPYISAAQGTEQIARLQTIRETLLAEFSPLCSPGSSWALTEEFQALQDKMLSVKWVNKVRALARQCPPASEDAIHTELTRPGFVLFEGAQGVLLDEWHGFHPHTTWSSINTAEVESAATRVGVSGSFEHYGVLRSYLTRHGTGPLPTHDESLDVLPEPHNLSEGWQGQFRRGHPDAVLLRYALETIGNLSGLLVSHCDVFQRGVTLKWCEHYSVPSPSPFSQNVNRLPVCREKNLAHQSMLTNLLWSARPHYASEGVSSAEAFLDRLKSVTPLQIVLHSYGAKDH